MKIKLVCVALLFNLSVYCQAWLAYSGLNAQQFQLNFDTLTPKGYVPFEIDAVNYYGLVLHSGIWRKEIGVVWESRSDLTAEGFQNMLKTLTPQGYIPSSITVYQDAENNTKYAAIWKKEPHVSFEIEIDLTEHEFQKLNDKLTLNGFIPYSLSFYKEKDEMRIAAVWKEEKNTTFIARYNLDEYEFQKTYDELTPQGYIPMEIDTYDNNGVINFAGVWIKKSGIAWEARSNMDTDKFQETFNDLYQKGYSPYIECAYMDNGILKYAAAWQYDFPQNILDISHNEDNFPTNDDERILNAELILPIDPVSQETDVWCWLACGEMIFRHYNIPPSNRSSYQCGIIGLISGELSPCYADCKECVFPAGSNYGTLNMISNYSMLTSGKKFTFSQSQQVEFGFIKRNIDNNKPLLCGTSYSRRQYFSDAEHAVLLVGYKIIDGEYLVIINDPFPYQDGQNPYLNHGATSLSPYQYEITYDSFKQNIFWHWTVSEISFD